MIKLTDKKTLQKILSAQKIKIKKFRGQNFLISQKILEKIIVTADLKRKDNILEVGAGLGTLTLALAPQVQKIIAVEKEEKFIPLLEKNFKRFSHVKIIPGDILTLNMPRIFQKESFIAGKYKIVANLPYYLSSHFLKIFLQKNLRPSSFVLLLQKEVAERITASPPKMNLLAVSVQIFGKPKIVFLVPKENFWPQPKITSAVLKIDCFEKPLIAEKEEKNFFRMVKAGFSQKRKTLVNALSAGLHLPKEKIKKIIGELGLPEKIRAQNLTLGDWQKINKKLLP